jgi:uncharacterized damage-inducible protein DinB
VTRSLLADAFEHHTWASRRVIDVCLGLSPEQLDSSAPGTYGSILDTVRHLVGSDTWYLHRISNERIPTIDEDSMDVAELREAMGRNADRWREILAGELDPEGMIVTRRSDGSETHAPLGIRLAQVLHHGTDHRSQICTILTTIGIAPPAIDLWDFGEATSRTKEIAAR